MSATRSCAPLFEPDGLRLDEVDIQFVDDTVPVEIEPARRALLNTPRECERIKNINATISVHIGAFKARSVDQRTGKESERDKTRGRRRPPYGFCPRTASANFHETFPRARQNRLVSRWRHQD